MWSDREFLFSLILCFLHCTVVLQSTHTCSGWWVIMDLLLGSSLYWKGGWLFGVCRVGLCGNNLHQYIFVVHGGVHGKTAVTSRTLLLIHTCIVPQWVAAWVDLQKYALDRLAEPVHRGYTAGVRHPSYVDLQVKGIRASRRSSVVTTRAPPPPLHILHCIDDWRVENTI